MSKLILVSPAQPVTAKSCNAPGHQTQALVQPAALFVLEHQVAIARAVSTMLGYPVATCEVVGPAVLAALARIADGLDPCAHIGWIAAAIKRELDPPRLMLDDTKPTDCAFLSAERLYQPRRRRADSADGRNHRHPAHRQQAKKAAAQLAGQTEMVAQGFRIKPDGPTEYDRERECEAIEFDPANNRPLGMPWACTLGGDWV